MSTVADWLTLAPKPAPLEQGRRWHVFLSYRSVNRPWVLQLYDVLRSLGYDVFLDQYVLSAAAPLALSLSEALAQSQSAVMIWSAEFADSEWCKKEYGTLESLEQDRKGFRFVIAKVDAAELPALAKGKIYVDFSEHREGPSGSGLLRLLYGLADAPLPPAAVLLAAQVDDQIKAGRAAIKSARVAGQVDRLLQLANSPDLAWRTSPALSCEVADALIGLGKNELALTVLAPIRERFPRALRPRQLTGLALARDKKWQDAQAVLGELYAAGEIDQETLGIYARTWMDRFKATGNQLYLLKSRDLYRQAFEAVPQDYYPGINAASKSSFLGERETAAQLAKRVEPIVGTRAIPGDYWRTATVAEVQLLQGNYDSAAALYLAAVADSPEDRGSHASTRDQAVLVLDSLGASAADRNKVLRAFAHLDA